MAPRWRDRSLPSDPLPKARAVLAGRQPAPASLSVVLITLDTLRADVLGCYGGAVATPHIDRLAREGVLFEQATATVPLTLPSHSSILTGLLPVRHGVRDNGGFFLEPSFTTLAERFQGSGYATGAFVGSWVLERRLGLAQGFDHYSDPLRGPGVPEARRYAWSRTRWRGSASFPPTGASWPGSTSSTPTLPTTLPSRSAPATRASRTTAKWPPSMPWSAACSRSWTAAGGGEKTIVVLMADHGESLGDHGEAEHGLFVYDATMAVPLLVRTPWGTDRPQPHPGLVGGRLPHRPGPRGVGAATGNRRRVLAARAAGPEAGHGARRLRGDLLPQVPFRLAPAPGTARRALQAHPGLASRSCTTSRPIRARRRTSWPRTACARSGCARPWTRSRRRARRPRSRRASTPRPASAWPPSATRAAWPT